MQLIYRIEKKDPSILLVHLEEKGTKRVLYLDQLKAAMQGADTEALSFLISLHLRSPNVSRERDTASFQRIEVSASQSLRAIQLLAKTGRLFFQGAALAYNPLPLPLLWKGEKHSERSCTINAYILDRPLNSVDLLFPGEPYWVIQGGVCQPLKTAVSWNSLERFVKGPQLLEGAGKKKFLEEDLSICWAKKDEKPLEVFPQLVLQDATGSFAHLWMDYPTLGRISFEDLCPTIHGKTRLKEAEAGWERDLIEAGFQRKVVGATRYFCPGDQVVSTLRFLLELGWQIFDAKGRRVLRQTGIHLSVREEEADLLVSAKAHFPDRSVVLHRAPPRLWLELDSHSVGLIDQKMNEPLSPFFAEGHLQGDALSLPRQKLSLLSSWVDSPDVQWAHSLKEKLLQMTSGIERAPPDPSFHGELLPYQQAGVDWLSHLHRWGFAGLLADEMGLGKTVQVLAFFSRLRTKLPLLIAAPTSLLLNWSRECSRFLPHLSPYIHSGPERCQDPLVLQTFPLMITSYAILRLDEELYSQIHFEAIVLDESQAIKNHQTQTARAASRLRANVRFCLSGTPIENRAAEFVSQFQFLLPKLLSFEDPPELLKQKSRPFFLRRRKSDVNLELPEKREQILWIDMTEEQYTLYNSYRSRFLKGLLPKVEQDGASIHRLEILEAILRLRQICAEPRLLDALSPGAKFSQLQEDLSCLTLERQKVLIFSQFTSLLSLLKRDLAPLRPLYLDGSMGYEERSEQVQQFQNDPDSQLFLLSLKAGGTGLNLTAASTVILFDPWWNPAVEQQAIDRAHRIGQTNPLLIKRYLIPNSIEEKMLALKEKKQLLSDQILSSTDDPSNWSAEDLFHLLF